MIKIFLVEDDETFRSALKSKLRRIEDFLVVGEAHNGLHAIQLVGDAKPDIILMDIKMPIIDGVEATGRIKKTAPGTRVIMLTGFHSESEVFGAFSAGADGYCLKNADVNRIELVIRAIAEGASWLDPGIAQMVLGKAVTGRPKAKTAGPKESGMKLTLSEREMGVLNLVANGLSNQQIAQQLHVSRETVKTHVERIMNKLEASSRTQAAVIAVEKGLI